MGGSPSYEAARPDPTQQALNTHTLERLKHDEVLLDAKRKTDDERAAAVKAGGQASYKSFVTNLENQYDTGLISADQVETKWKDYKGAYTLGAEYGLDDYTRFQTTASTKETGNREYKAGRLFEDLLNRKADTSESTKYKEDLSKGISLSDIADSIKSKDEYKNKFLTTAESEVGLRYGDQLRDDTGKKTGKYTYTFNPSFGPQASKGLASTTGVNFGAPPATAPGTVDAPTSTFTGTVEEIEGFRKQKEAQSAFMYNAGLTNLQGQIEKETTKLKNTGAKDVANIQAQGQLMSNLTSGFWS